MRVSKFNLTPITSNVTSPRQTPPPRFNLKKGLKEGFNIVLKGVEKTTSVLPGGAIFSAAIREIRENTLSPQYPEAPLRRFQAEQDMENLLELQRQNQLFSMYYLNLQETLSRENRRFSTISNVMKARHETAKTAINNIR
jgi:hypothetical protein